MMDRVSEWWDALELWIVQLWYPVQIAAVILMVLPVCWMAAGLIDQTVDRLAHLVDTRLRGRADHEANGHGPSAGSTPVSGS